MKRATWLLPLAVAILLASSPTRAQQIHFVDADATAGNNDGTSWPNAFTHLDLALAHADGGDEIWVAEGTYVPSTGGGDLYSTFTIPNGVGLYGGFAGTETSIDQRDFESQPTILSGDEERMKVVTTDSTDSTTVIDGFTITKGGAWPSVGSGDPGGIVNHGGSPTLRNLIISENDAPSEIGGGGGMRNYGGNPTLQNVLFTGNGATRAGGLFNRDGSPHLSYVRFEHNGGWYGGGGMTSEGMSFPVLEDVVFYFNSAGNHSVEGGGFENIAPSKPTLRRVSFIGNMAMGLGFGADCGGMSGADGATLIDVSFIGNRSHGTGGLCAGPATSMINAAFIGNIGNYGAGAFTGVDSLVNVLVAHNSGYHTAFWLSGNKIVINSTIAFNTITRTDFIAAPSATYLNSILWETELDTTTASTFGNSIIQGGLPAGAIDEGYNLDVDPMFVDIDGPDDVAGNEDDDFTLMHGSLAIEAGEYAYVPPDVFDLDEDGNRTEKLPFDLNGNDRIAGAYPGTAPRVDIGAYEAPAPLPIVLTAFDVVVDGRRATLTWTVDRADAAAGFAVEETFGTPGTDSGFEQLGFVPAVNTNESKSYAFALNDVDPGQHAYRLRLIDVDGSFVFSRVVAVNVSLEQAYEVGSVYPNPARDVARFELWARDEQRVRADVFDAQGRRVATALDETLLPNTKKTVLLETGRWAPGLYFCRIRGGRLSTTIQVIVVR